MTIIERIKSALGVHPAYVGDLPLDPAAGARADYVLDPWTGLPMADPSGVLQEMGYARSTVDTVVTLGDAAVDSAKNVGAGLFTGLKVVLVVAVVVAAIVAAAETRKALGG